MKYVYLLQSLSHPEERYTGLTDNLNRRLDEHNAGKSSHTSKYRPWEIVTAIRFENESKASEFEIYIKSGSGRAFANKHFW